MHFAKRPALPAALPRLAHSRAPLRRLCASGDPSNETRAASAQVRTQFGRNAERYAVSGVHARGASLSLLSDLLLPQPDWDVLDVATGAGHAAFALAPYVNSVTAADVVPEMLATASEGASARGLANIAFVRGDAEALPFGDFSFDSATCRVAAHHFAHPTRFVSETHRVLRKGGSLALVDNVVDDDAAEFVNGWERRRDPSHVRMLSMARWVEVLRAGGLEVERRQMLLKRMKFAEWAENMSVPETTREELLRQLERATGAAREYLRPILGEEGDQEAAVFHLTEGVFIARRI